MPSGLSLHIETCVIFFIMRSPTQLVLRHKSTWNTSVFSKLLINIFASYIGRSLSSHTADFAPLPPL
jgi:hypothetical protein